MKLNWDWFKKEKNLELDKVIEDAKKIDKKELDRRKLKRLLDPDSKCRNCAYSITTTCRYNYNPMKCGKVFKEVRDLKKEDDSFANEWENMLSKYKPEDREPTPGGKWFGPVKKL